MGEDEKKATYDIGAMTADQLLSGLRAIRDEDQRKKLRSKLREARSAALDYQYNVYVLVYVATQGAQIMALRPETLERLDKKEGADKDWNNFLRDAAKVANEEKSGGFPQLYALGSVAIWTGLEDAVNTLLELYVRYEPRALEKMKKLDVNLVEYLRLSEAERPAFVIAQLENKLGSKLKNGLGVFESVFDALGIHCDVDEETRDTLYELHKVRNCVVHRRGIADKRLVSECPSLGLRIGDQVRVEAGRYGDYFTATSTYIRILYATVAGEAILVGGLSEALRAGAEAKVESESETEVVESTDTILPAEKAQGETALPPELGKPDPGPDIT